MSKFHSMQYNICAKLKCAKLSKLGEGLFQILPVVVLLLLKVTVNIIFHKCHMDALSFTLLLPAVTAWDGNILTLQVCVCPCGLVLLGLVLVFTQGSLVIPQRKCCLSLNHRMDWIDLICFHNTPEHVCTCHLLLCTSCKNAITKV